MTHSRLRLGFTLSIQAPSWLSDLQGRVQALQAELAELRQTVRRLQSQNKLLTRQNLLAKQQAVDFHPSPCLDWQV